MRQLLLFLSGLALISIQANAADNKQASAERFVSLLRYEEQFNSYKNQCVAMHQTVSAEALVARNPDYFNGIRPGHKRWSAVTTAYQVYFQEACSRPSKAEFLGALSTTYAKSLSTQQLNEALAFYSTPTGQALVSAHKQAATAVYEAWTSINGKHLADITARFQDEVARLAQSK
jgi:hypothetical protein